MTRENQIETKEVDFASQLFDASSEDQEILLGELPKEQRDEWQQQLDVIRRLRKLSGLGMSEDKIEESLERFLQQAELMELDRSKGWLKLGLWDAKKIQIQIANEGGVSRIIGDGDADANLQKVFRWSLLGKRLGWEINAKKLTDYERSLWESDYKMLAIVDFDGVIVSLTHELVSLIKSPNRWRTELASWRELSQVAFNEEKKKWLSNVVKAADKTFLWTSRSLSEDKNFFPFFPQYEVTQLEKMGEDKLAVATNKSLGMRSEALRQLIESAAIDWKKEDLFLWKSPVPDMTCVIGSSFFDRRAVLTLLRQNHQYADKLVFFDTAHLVL